MAIKEFDYIVLKKDSNWKNVQIIKKKQIWMCKMKFVLDGVIGQQFGSSFKILDGQLVKLDASHLDDDDTYEKDEAVLDNRDLVDDCESQKVSKEELQTLHKQGVTGDEIVEHLIKNSSTFSKKTEFSQQKYIKKKRKKHVAVFTVLKPNTRNLIDLYYSRGPTKICNLRMDSLAQILTQSNVQATSRALVVESCCGIVVGAILERLAGFGRMVHLYTGTAPNRPALTDGYNFPANILKSLYSFPLNEANTLRCTSVPVDLQGQVAARDISHSAMVTDETLAVTTVNNGDMSTSIISTSENCEEDILPNSASLSCEQSEPSSCIVSEVVDVAADCPQAEPKTSLLAAEQLLSINSQLNVGETVQFTAEDKMSSSGGSSGRSRNRNRNSSKRCHSEVERTTKQHHLDEAEERERRRLMRLEQIQRAKVVIEAGNMDCLIVATKFHATPIVLRLLEFVAPSRPIVIFSPYKEPLLDCFMKLKETNKVLMIKLSETWLRSYQVLPDRTHPCINMSGGGGYLLTAMTVCDPEPSK